MKRVLFVTLVGLVAASCTSTETKEARLNYPVARNDNVIDDDGGTKVADPYRWMEALDSKDVAAWVAASNAVTEPYLEESASARALQQAADRVVELSTRWPPGR